MKNTIMIFTMRNCPFCLELKNELTKQKIPYTEFKIHEHKGVWEQVVKQTGLRHLPTVFISEGDTEMGPVYVSNRDYVTTDEIVSIIKTYL